MFEHDVAFQPLGGDFQDRFWPLSEEQIAATEAAIGWALPDDYRAFVLEYGVARTAPGYMRVRRDDGHGEPDLWVLHGDCGSYSVVDHAPHRASDGLLLIAHSDTGQFYLRQDGTIYFETPWGGNGSAVIASSFTDLLDRLYDVPDD